MTNEVSFAYIKSEGIGAVCERDVYKELADRELELIQVKDIFMNYLKLRKHQPILFDIKGDMNDIWKIQGAARLIGTTVRSLLIEGDNAIRQTFDVKTNIRMKYALPTEFDRENEMSYPNYMHAADNKAQVQSDVEVLLPEELEYIQKINGDHPIAEKVW